jgi:hypothetical protein
LALFGPFVSEVRHRINTGQTDSGLWVAQLFRRRRVARPAPCVIDLKVALPSIGNREGDRATYPC